mmetsp:Transcript_15484/g.38554  ORF Transcript_15484/g.38554 Transcript_15484/m.38554 type:complete len:1319 (-) Transcript_15484:220-4176(-)
MGFDLGLVVSDTKHYEPFICKVCHLLSDLDAVVTNTNATTAGGGGRGGTTTTSGSNLYCRVCLEVYLKNRIRQDLPLICPISQQNIQLSTPPPPQQQNNNNDMTTMTITMDDTIDGAVAGSSSNAIYISAEPLQQVQPIAYWCLQLVQIRNVTNDSVGDYGALSSDYYNTHRRHSTHGGPVSPGGLSPPLYPSLGGGRHDKGTITGSGPSAPPPSFGAGGVVGGGSGRGGGGPERTNGHSRIGVRGEPTGAHHLRSLGDDNVENFDHEELQRAMDRCDKLKKQANAKFNRGEVEGARVLYSEGLALIANFPISEGEVRIMIASLYSNRAVTFYRERILEPSVEDCDKSLQLDPKSEKTYIRKWRALDAMGRVDDAIACLETGTRELPQSSKLQEQLRKAKTPGHGSGTMMDMGRSIASMSYGGGGLDKETVVSKNYEMDISVAGDPHYSVLERAERLKKQANARFNKGDIEAARTLYSDSLGCITPSPHYSRGVKALLSELYSNRGVTFYRSKHYQESLDDCERAIELDPDAEKSYIRKARALASLERHNEAHQCLQDASRRYPNSKKIKEELSKMAETAQELSNLRRDSNDSGEFNNSVGSFGDFYAQDAARSATGGATLSTGKEELTYAEELGLADKLKRNANAKFNKGDISGARLLYTEALACLPSDKENDAVRTCLASLYANRAVTFYREREFGPSVWDCDKAIELDPKGEKSYTRKARALASLHHYNDAIECLEEGKRQVPGSDKLEEELAKIKEEQAAHAADGAQKNFSESQAGQDFQVSYSSQMEFNSSQNNANLHATQSGPPKQFMGSVPESRSQEFDLPGMTVEDFERAEKLKKQANAKLNKQDVEGARVLYGEGLACLPTGFEKSPEGRELAASLYANRAVTFFREKKFAETINDCNKSLEFDPKHEKSYVRKWRALMALGNFEDAFKCLQVAVREKPDSERLGEELDNATEQRELLITVNNLMATGEYQEARDTLKPLIKNSDNVSLWLAAARADAYLGQTESALERVNKVLMFNAKHDEALRVRGLATFLSGEMEHGISLLKEALEGDIGDGENVNQDASDLLHSCQQSFNSFSRGQQRVKRGRYREAVDLFTSSIEDGERIPDGSPLYGILLTERAEANLLSDQFEAALADCTEAISLKEDNMTAWTVKIEVYFALGRLQEARDELLVARKTWGAGNEIIEDAYRKTDFELRMKKADDELHKLAALVETGVTPDESGPLHMNSSERRSSTPGRRSSGAGTGNPGSSSKQPRSNRKLLSRSSSGRATSRSKRDLMKGGRQSSQKGLNSRERGGGRQGAAAAAAVQG